LLRLTEVEVHGSDLDVGLDDWSAAFVETALPFRLDWLNSRRSNHRAVDEGVQGSWLLHASDGSTYLVSVKGASVESRPADPSAPARATIEGDEPRPAGAAARPAGEGVASLRRRRLRAAIQPSVPRPLRSPDGNEG